MQPPYLAERVERHHQRNAQHAPGAHVLVQIRYSESTVRVVISNGPATRSAGSGLSATGSGFGITGLRQRVELLHGTLRAGPAPDGGFRLEAVLPAYIPTAEPAEHTGELAQHTGEPAEHTERAEQHEPARGSA